MTTAVYTTAEPPLERDAVAVRVRGLVKRYADVTAVAGVDFDVARGTCLGLLGPNGAGKTTTVEMLEGLTRRDEGEISILGLSWERDGREIRERIGAQLQETKFQDKLRVREILRLFSSFFRAHDDYDTILDTVALTEKRDAFIKTLSGGQKQRLSVGCALLNNPEIVFLDEPTTGLDPQARRRVWEIVERIKAAGGTVLLTTHYMEEAERLADDLIIMDHGRVIARGSPAEIIATLNAESVVQFSCATVGDHILTEEDLAALDGVNAVRQEGPTIVLTVSHAQDVISGLFTLVESRGLVLDDLRTHRPTLEDVFVSLTGKSLRDG